LFVAAWPPPEVVAALRELPRPERHGVRWTAAESWHVTLRFLGEAPSTLARQRLARLEWSATSAALGPRVERLGRGHVVVPVAGVDAVAAAVRQVTTGIGRSDEDRPFRGHLTLARLKPGITVELEGATITAEFAVTEVTLVESELHPSGARYRVLARQPATAGAA
jgi:2'-5' RNA ligase